MLEGERKRQNAINTIIDNVAYNSDCVEIEREERGGGGIEWIVCSNAQTAELELESEKMALMT